MIVCSLSQSSRAICRFERPRDDAREDGDLAGRQTRPLPGLLGPLGRDDALAAGDPAEQVEQLVRRHGLVDDPVRLELARPGDRGGVEEGREDHDPHLGEPPPELLQADEPVHLRHPDVEQDDVGVGLRDDRQHLGAVDGLADDDDVLVGREVLAQREEDESMIVRDDEGEGFHGRSR